jgi:adenylate cyclase
MFSRRFPPRVRENITRQACAGLLSIGARSMPVTVLDADIRGFTQLTEQLGALRTNDLINEYFPQLMAAVFSQGGTIDRFVGDAIFAVFGSPEPDENQHEHAVRAAIGLQEAMAASDARRAARGVATCGIGIGIDCGDAFAGFIGNSEWMDFAVVGPAANRASRYCAAAAAGELLISPEVHQRVWKIVEAEPRKIVTKNEREFSAYRVLRLACCG